MLDVFNIAKPQNCDIQTFYGAYNNAIGSFFSTWNKPRGVSHVYILLIAAGRNGNGTDAGGASGGVVCWYGAAQHVPDILYVSPGNNAQSYVCRGPSLNASDLLLEAYDGTASSNTYAFAASGFINVTVGQAGSLTNISPSSTTFLSGGADTTGNTVTGNYGYTSGPASGNPNGFFLIQPIIISLGGTGSGRGGIGSGGGRTGLGGPGMVLIASW
jgi:hypothetical protein